MYQAFDTILSYVTGTNKVRLALTLQNKVRLALTLQNKVRLALVLKDAITRFQRVYKQT